MILISLMIVKFQLNISSNMVFYMSPMHQSIESFNNETKTIYLKMETITTYSCIIECNYEFNDLSDNKTIDSGILSFSRKKDFSKSYNITSPLLGYGQKVYHFDVLCRNKKSISCWFRNPTRGASSAILLNYKLRGVEESMKNQLKINLADVLKDLSVIDVMTQMQDLAITDTDSVVNFVQINSNKSSLDANFSKLKERSEEARRLWGEENYAELYLKMKEIQQANPKRLLDETNLTSIEIDNAIIMHNLIANSIASKKENTNIILNILMLDVIPSSMANHTNNYLSSLNYFFDALNGKKFVSYNDILSGVASLDYPYEIIKNSGNTSFSYLIGKGNELTAQGSQLTCSLKGYICNNDAPLSIYNDGKANSLQVERICINLASLKNKMADADANFTLYYYKKRHPEMGAVSFEEAYANLTIELNLTRYNSNNEFISLKQAILQNQTSVIKNKWIGSLNGITQENNAKVSALNNDIKERNNTVVNETIFYSCNLMLRLFNEENNTIKKNYLFPKVEEECRKYINHISSSKDNFTALDMPMLKAATLENASEFIESNITDSQILDLSREMVIAVLNITLQDIDKYINDYCSKVTSNLSGKIVEEGVLKNTLFLVQEVNFAKKRSYNVTMRINLTLIDPSAKCCVFGQCEKCCINDDCRNEESLFPVIIFHGHAFNKDSPPTFSLDISESIQNSLTKDGYIDAGILLPFSNYTGVIKNDLGAARKPVSIRATYYVDFNSENFRVDELNQTIKNYSSRIKEIIDFVRYRTGKSKVNIIAHSMGGLVVRQYLEDYGEKDVNKLITIATPHQGISEKTREICLISGRQRECYEMSEGSDFLKNLNGIPLKNETKIYSIYASGCDTEGKDGDKVVQKDSAILANAINYEMKANCSRIFDVPHLAIMDIAEYPKTYEIIKSILNER
ncbi:MAG: alpha/beta fold hydrolase [archaeon]